MMIPSYLQEVFLPFAKIGKTSCITSGSLRCCTNKFLVFFSGKLKSGILGKQYFGGDDNGLAILCKCSVCGKSISVFDSDKNGYNACIEVDENKNQKQVFHQFFCNKCNGNKFTIEISFEYLPEEELENDGFTDISNAFTWIYGSITCVSCGKHYKRILDFETC